MRYTLSRMRDKTSLHPGHLGEGVFLAIIGRHSRLGVWRKCVEPVSAKNNPRPYVYFRGTSNTLHEYLAVPVAFLGVVGRFWHKARKLTGQ